MTPSALAELIVRAVDGTLSAEDAALLTAACREDPSVLETLTSHLTTERLLHAVSRDPQGRFAAQEFALRLEQERFASVHDASFVPRVVDGARRRLWLPRLALAAAAVLMAAITAHFFQELRPNPVAEFTVADGPPSIREESAPPVAVLKRAVDVEWDRSAPGPAIGAMLPAGWIRLRAGTVQLEFLSGARLLVMGPAELRLDTENAAFLKTGKLSAYVPPPAEGFILQAVGVEIVDLGTAFGLQVPPEGEPEVHVLDGKISVAGPQGQTGARTLHAGQATRVGATAFHDIPLRAADFPNGEELARRGDANGRTRARIWQAASHALSQEPETLLSFTFQDEAEWSRTVANHALQADPETDGALVGAGWTAGRWPGKRALEFRGRGDRLRFTIPGQHPQLTLMAWVRVDSLPNAYNSLLLPSQYQPGSLHWTIEGGGELRLSMMSTVPNTRTAKAWETPVSGPAVSNLDFGRWIFLATTYDAATGTVAHYRDGQRVASATFTHRLPAVLGPMEFGNWGADGTTPSTRWTRFETSALRTRNFVGVLDELAISSRVLSEAEIAHLYELGQP